MTHSIFSRRLRVILALLATAFAAGCGGEGLQTSLSLENAYCPVGQAGTSAMPDALRIETYRVTLSGEDFEPITVDMSGNTASAPIEGIPKGEDRTLLIEALNNRGQVVCRRQLTGIEIRGGKLALIEISLLAVPFIANLSDGNLVTQTRLTFQGYGEPVGAVEILDLFQGNETVLTDLNTSSEMVSPSLQDASFKFQPPVLGLGEHLFTVRDVQTGEQSQVRVTLVRPGRVPGRGLSVAGALDLTQSQTVGRNDLFIEALEALIP